MVGKAQKEHIEKDNLDPRKHRHLNKGKMMRSRERACTHVGEHGNIESERHESVRSFAPIQARS